MTVRQQTFAGVRWTTFSAVGRLALQLAQIVLLARLLTPATFGLVATVVAVLAVLQVFADGGISSAVIHFRDVTAVELDNLYWLNVGVGAALTLLLILGRGAVARWYEQPELAPLLLVAAGSLFVTALGQQLRVMAQKRLRFAELAKVDLGGGMVGGIVAVGLALSGAGAYALVAGTLGTAAATTVLAWLRLADGWRPRARLRWANVQRFARFGAFTVGNNLVNTFNSQVDVLLGGRLLGARGIGLYSVPKDLSLRLAGLINPIVTEVSFPVMAAAQKDQLLVRRVYLQMMRMVSSVTFPAYVAMALFAPEVVQVLLGDDWAAAAPVLRILAVWALVRSTANPVGSLVMALGRPGLNFGWNLAVMALAPVAVIIGSRGGAAGVALAMLVLGLLLFIPGWYVLVHQLTGAGLVEYTGQVALPLGISIGAGLAAQVSVLPFEHHVLRLALGLATGSLVYAVASWYLNRRWCLAMLELAGRRVQTGGSDA